MPVSVVVGGQFGSEGKGKIAHFLAREKSASFAVRVGGSNSGHTVIDHQGKARIFRQLPTACLLDSVGLVIGPGSYIDVDLLLCEVDASGVAPGRIYVDANAVIVDDSHKDQEASSRLGERIGSTQTGIGAAVVERATRLGTVRFARDEGRLAAFNVCDTSALLRSALNARKWIIIEGTQGFGLSLLHSPYYPFVTSRDTSAAAFVSEAGLSPMDVDEIVLVIRAHPIRVAGNSGPLPNECDWDSITRESGSPDRIEEKTSVTAKTRRVAHFDADIVKKAIAANNPTRIVLNHLDYVDASVRTTGRTTSKTLSFVRDAEEAIGADISDVGIGPSTLVRMAPKLMQAAR